MNGNKTYRYRVVVAGRRSGKTHLSLVEAILFAARRPAVNVFYCAPTYKQAKQIAWEPIKKMVANLGILAAKPNETELTLRLTNGSWIYLKGTDKFDSLRGVGLDFLIMDEYADMDPKAWTEVLRPALSDRSGHCLFIGSPKSRNHFYKLYLRGQSTDPGDSDWASWQINSYEAGIIPQSEIESAKLDMDEKVFAQEYLASFITFGSVIYHAFSREVHVKESVKDAPDQELIVGMDFNINPMSACLAVKAADQLHIFDDIELMGSNTEEMCTEIRSRFPKRKIRICPDPAGRRRITTAPLGQTDLTIIRNFGMTVDCNSRPPLVIDRINTVNGALKPLKGPPRIYVSPKASSVIASLEGHSYRDGTRIPDKSSGLDHMADAVGYLVIQHFGLLLRGRTSVEKMADFM